MNWFIQLFSRSRSVEAEVLQRLPSDITFEFRAEFDEENNPIIFAFAPKYEGLITEGLNFQEAVQNACDAILTYFNVPRDYAKLIEYQMKEGTPQGKSLSKDKEPSLKEVILYKHTTACA